MSHDHGTMDDLIERMYPDIGVRLTGVEPDEEYVLARAVRSLLRAQPHAPPDPEAAQGAEPPRFYVPSASWFVVRALDDYLLDTTSPEDLTLAAIRLWLFEQELPPNSVMHTTLITRAASVLRTALVTEALRRKGLIRETGDAPPCSLFGAEWRDRRWISTDRKRQEGTADGNREPELGGEE